MNIDEILNSQFEDKPLRYNFYVSVINRKDLDDIIYTRRELINSLRKTINDVSTLEFEKIDGIIIQDILINKELFAEFKIKTIEEYYEYNSRYLYPDIPDELYRYRSAKLLFDYHQIGYYNYLISLFNDRNLLSVIEWLMYEDGYENIYRMLIYEDDVESYKNHYDIIRFGHKIKFNDEDFNKYLHNDFNLYDAKYLKFVNVDICHLTIIDLISENKYLNYFLEKLILGHELSLEEKFDYLIDNCPIIADQLVIDQLTTHNTDIYLLFLMDDIKYHYYLHELIYRLIDKRLMGKFEKEIYYILAHIINERPIYDNKPLNKEEKAIILELLEKADDYPNAKELLNRTFFSFIGLDLKNIPDIQVTCDWKTFLDIGQFLVNYRKS